MVEVPPVVEEFRILTDTTESRHYEMRTINFEVRNEGQEYTDWTMVLCDDELTEKRIGEIQFALMESGYYKGSETKKVDTPTKSALYRFQMDHRLPIGQMDYKTLEKLGITIE